MALGDENVEDEKEEKPKVYKSAIDSEDVASTSRNSHRPAAGGVGEQDDVKQEKNDVCLEANVQPCPSSSGSASLSGDGISKHPSKDATAVSGASTAAASGISPKTGNGKATNGASAATCSDASRSTAFTRTNSNRFNGFDAFMNGLSTNPNYYVGMSPGLAYLAAGPSSGGSSTPAHGVLHPMASYPHNLPVLYQAAAATAHLMGNRFPGSPNPASSPFSFQQGAGPFAGFSPCYPTAPDGGQSAPSQAAAGPAAFPFALCTDPKSVGLRSPFAGFFTAGQCSPSFGPPMLMQPTVLDQWYAAARYGSPMFPLMMTAAAGSAPVPCSPNATLSPIINSSPIAGGATNLTASALAPPALIPAYPAAYGATSLRFPSSAASATNALAAMSQIPVPVVSTSVKTVATNLAANAGSSSSSRGSVAQNGSTSMNSGSASKHRTSTSAIHDQRHHDENGLASNSVLQAPNRSISEKALKKLTHIKKPLNAFMLYMKEMRPIVMQEVGLKERQSAEINRILGRRWHSLTRDEQQKYYDLARQERTLHMQRYPNWSARDNYALHKKKKRKRDKAQENLEMKKCRARFGLDQQSKWCKHCRRKKKCLWFREGTATGASTTSSSGIQENGADSAEQSPPAQVTSTTNGPDMLGASSAAMAAETDVNSPQSLVTSTISIGIGGRLAPPSANGGWSPKKKLPVGVAAMPKNGTSRSGLSPARKKRRHTISTGGDVTDDDDGDASSSGSDDDDMSSDGDDFDEDDIDEEAEAAAAARAAVEGMDFDEEMSALISPPSSDQNNRLVEEGQSSTVT